MMWSVHAMEKFLITGGQGCIGAWITRQLLAEGIDFTLVDLEPNEFILEQVLDADAIASLDRVYGDISASEFTQGLVAQTRPLPAWRGRRRLPGQLRPGQLR